MRRFNSYRRDGKNKLRKTTLRKPSACPSGFNFELLESRMLLAANLLQNTPIDSAWFGSAGGAGAASVQVQTVQWQGKAAEMAANEYVVKFAVDDSDSHFAEFRTSLAARGLPLVAQKGLGMEGLVMVKSSLNFTATVNLLNSLPDVEFFEPNFFVRTASLPNDPLFSSQWPLHNTGGQGGKADADIDAPEAWGITKGSKSVVVAVIDTGIDRNHPDLASNMWVNPGEIPGNGIDDDGNGFVDDVYGWDFYASSPVIVDHNGHGTHVAGTIGARGNNGVGVSGVAQQVSLMSLAFMGPSGSGYISNAISAINYATMMRTRYGVNVVASNNSWGSSNYSATLEYSVSEHLRADVVFVAAAGNSDKNTDVSYHFPSAFNLPNIISVGSTNRNDQPSSFSNFGQQSVDVWAPGENIMSTWVGGGYKAISGTSMAAPHVAGIAALLKTKFPQLTVSQLKAKIMSSVDVLSTASHKPTVTGGRVNAHRSLTGNTAPPPLAVTYQLVPSGNKQRLVINGTPAADQIYLMPDKPGIFSFDTILYANGIRLASFDTYRLDHIEVHGFAGNDIIDAKGVDVPLTIHGGDGNDRLGGGKRGDLIYGGNGDDDIRGRGGNDVIFGDLDGAGIGNDIIRGGPGNDILRGGAGNDLIIGGKGSDQIFGEAGADMLAGGKGTDEIDGGRGRNEIWQNELPAEAKRRYLQEFRTVQANSVGTNLEFRAIGGVFTAQAVAGTTTNLDISVRVENGALVVRTSGVLVSVIRDWTPIRIHLRGGAGNDRLENATAYASRQWGGAGNDTLIGGSAVDELFGELGNDTLYGMGGPDWLEGGDGDDLLYGGAGNDYLDGGNGRDQLFGQAGNDKLWGRLGDDYLYGGDGDDELHGNEGIDRLYGGAGNDILRGGQGNDFLYGDVGNDEMHGGDGDDYLEGGDGHDKLYGGNGSDTLKGGAGNDYLWGGAGVDYLYGGAGDDTIDARDGLNNDFVFDNLGVNRFLLDNSKERKN